MQRGFTLLELLVALSIFALISAMAYSGMNSVMKQRAHTELKADQLKKIQVAYNILERDFGQLVDRPIRDEYGNERPALAGSGGIEGVELTHAGYANPARFKRSELQRVRYIAEGEKLLRYSWKVLDRATDSEASEQVLSEKITRLAMRYLSHTDDWLEIWPPIAKTGLTSSGLPRAVELTLETEDFGELIWLFRLPETFIASTPVPVSP